MASANTVPAATTQPSPTLPRRPPAHKSVSLMHSPTRRTLSNVQSRQSPLRRVHTRDDSGSVPTNMRNNKKNSSGESSNADNWFEKSNNNVSQGSNTFIDNDPPFFLRTGSSSDSPPDNQRHGSGPPASGIGRVLLQRSGVVRGDSQAGSSSEDFRSVIDDLTVENKKLKRKLKRFEKLHDAHLQDEKLFEVRIHGLPPNKKRELEDTLRQFALSLDASPFSGSPLPLDRFVPAFTSQKTGSSSHTSNQLIADSAYASMSASGQGSSVPGHTSTGMNNHDRSEQVHPKSAKSRDANIHSYLHDIPEGLLPRRPPVMTEKAKSKLVVRRLEQIFAGKGAAVEGHQQPLQQQEVSQLAAKADRSEIEARGQLAGIEGLREARIMPEETEDPMYFNKNKDQSHPEPMNKAQPIPQLARPDLREGSSPEQRPTRPLDLDPYRAQVPTENIDYIRHLGFSPPDVRTMSLPEEGHGWIYLNLLINMAQLHTLNVTSEFVKKALTDFSSKFELSNDGRKVRWRGGQGISKTSSDGSSSADFEPEAYYRSREHNRRKRSKAGKAETAAAVQPSSDGQQKSTNNGGSNNQVSYTPLFFHRENSDNEAESSYEDSGLESPQPAYVTGDSSGLASSGMRTNSSRRKRDDGPIIFYNKARFCTDLSGDRGAAGKDRLHSFIDYQSVTANGIGGEVYDQRNGQSIESGRGPLSRATQLPDAMDLDDNPIPAEEELAFPSDSPSKSSGCASRKSSPEPMELEVSGLGGVCPDDNFEITVKNRHIPTDQHTMQPQATHSFGKKVFHHRLAAILASSRRSATPTVEEQIVATKRKNLPPSALPPASYFPAESSPETDESDADSDASQTPESPDREAPATAPQPLTIPVASSDEEFSEESEDDGDDDESDASVDLLAAAREIDPAKVQQQEREYDSHVAERLAEEIPAGSSAATAGGGSGFASPASALARRRMDSSGEEDAGSDEGDEVKTIPNSGLTAKGPAGLKRSRTSDSMVVHGKAPRLD